MHLKTDNVDYLKKHLWKFIFCIFLQSTHQVDMENVVKSCKHIFEYLNTLETHSVTHVKMSVPEPDTMLRDA